MSSSTEKQNIMNTNFPIPMLSLVRHLTNLGEDHIYNWNMRGSRRMTWLNRYFTGQTIKLDGRASVNMRFLIIRWRKACKHIQKKYRKKYINKKMTIILDKDCLSSQLGIDVSGVVKMYM